MTPTRITLKLTAAGLEVVAEYAPEPIDTDGEEVTGLRHALPTGLRKTGPALAAESKRAAGAGR